MIILGTDTALACTAKSTSLLDGIVVCSNRLDGDPGGSTTTGGKSSRKSGGDHHIPQWRKPGKPKQWPKAPDEAGWKPEEGYKLDTQDPCYGITDPAMYAQCQAIPWLGGDTEVNNDDGDDGEPPLVQITAAQAAQQVIAQLEFTAAQPGVAPNRRTHGLPFDSAVGYPVWLWAEGGTRRDSVTEAVGPYTVQVSVKLASVTWNLGDGTKMRCDTGTKWTKNNHEPAEPSPTCGHRYQRTGHYTISATSTWTINWTAGGQSGSQEFSITADRPWEVGELQVVTR